MIHVRRTESYVVISISNTGLYAVLLMGHSMQYLLLLPHMIRMYESHDRIITNTEHVRGIPTADDDMRALFVCYTHTRECSRNTYKYRRSKNDHHQYFGYVCQLRESHPLGVSKVYHLC